MKKIIFTLLLAIIATFSYSQLTFKAGLVNSLDIDDKLKHSTAILGSAMIEGNYNISGTVAITLNAAFLRADNSGEGYNQFPVLAGIKYRFDETFYTGIGAGASFFDEKVKGTLFCFSPYIGANIKRISVDVRYLHACKSNPLMMTALVLSYNF